VTDAPISVDDVTAIIVTRGDVSLNPIRESLIFDSVIVWDNRKGEDLGAFGRYAAIEEAESPYIYVQDDDCVLTEAAQLALLDAYEPDVLVSNMPSDWNGSAMPLLALPGWGAIFDWYLPEDAFHRWKDAQPRDFGSDDFNRIGCDIVFPVLTESRMIDLGHHNLPHAEGSDRTCKQADYQRKKSWYYGRAQAILTGAPWLQG
jgi:hypothetical protein